MLGAGEGDRQEPVFPPRAAVLFLDGAAVAAQARRAVADTGAEQPGLADRWPAPGLTGTGPGRSGGNGLPRGRASGQRPRSLSAAWRARRSAVPRSSRDWREIAGDDAAAHPVSRARRSGAMCSLQDRRSRKPCRDSPCERVQAARQGPCCRGPDCHPPAAGLVPWSSKTVFRGRRFFFGCGGRDVAGGDVRDLAGIGVEVGEVAQADRGAGQQFAGEPFLAGGDRLGAAVLDEAAEQPDDAVGAAEQVLGHLAGGEHAAGGPQEPELVLDPGQVLEERGDPGRGGVVERVEVGQVEPPAGLGGGRVAVSGGGEGPLAGGRVGAGARRAARSRGCRRRSARGWRRGPSARGSGPGCPGHRRGAAGAS